MRKRGAQDDWIHTMTALSTEKSPAFSRVGNSHTGNTCENAVDDTWAHLGEIEPLSDRMRNRRRDSTAPQGRLRKRM